MRIDDAGFLTPAFAMAGAYHTHFGAVGLGIKQNQRDAGENCNCNATIFQHRPQALLGQVSTARIIFQPDIAGDMLHITGRAGHIGGAVELILILRDTCHIHGLVDGDNRVVDRADIFR